LATRGQRGAGSPTRGTSRLTVGPAAATARGAGQDHPAHRRRDVRDATTVSTSIGRSRRRARGGNAHVPEPRWGRSGRPRGNGVDRTGDRGRAELTLGSRRARAPAWMRSAARPSNAT
jgi:hypothetical protein